MQQESRLQSFLNNPARAMWSMAIPIVAGMMVQTLFNIVDIMFIAWWDMIGPNYEYQSMQDLIAKVLDQMEKIKVNGYDNQNLGVGVVSVGLVSPLFFIIIGLTVGLGAGVTASIAQYIGKKDKKNADNCAQHAVFLGVIITLFLTVLGVYFGEDLLRLLGAEDSRILSTAYSYLEILIFGIGGVVFSLFFRAILAGEGETKIPMIIGLVGTMSNLVLDPIFIFILGKGVDGAAIATVLSQVVMLAMYFFVIFIMKKTFLSFDFSRFHYSPSILKMIFVIGIPSSLSMLIMSFGQAVMNKILINYDSYQVIGQKGYTIAKVGAELKSNGVIIMPALGEAYVAAYQIVSRIDMLLFMPCLGIAIALTTIVGMFFGAQEFSKLVWVVKYGISRAVIITTVNVAILFLAAEKILPIFSANQEVLSVGITYLKIIVLVYPAVAVSVICARICQALGKGMPLLVVTTIRVLIITAPLSFYFYLIGKPIVWVWYSQVIAVLVAAFISFLFMRFYFKKFGIVRTISKS